MPVYESTQTVTVTGTPEECFDVLTDYERMPEWQSRVCECRVLSRDADGLAEVVEYAIDVKLRTVRYRLRQYYDRPKSIDSEYLDGDFRCFEGDYRFTEQDGGTEVRFHLRIDPGLRVPGPVARMLNQAVMGRALQDLKRRVELVSDGA
ncbi:MAG TPA: SRPBCC family protein [Solirubrobacteraceae bacterium]|jgi:coenzyme Q-binding protein COQ10|nr:SRPBCC family protein [Solirubrobacteraceae bacterium]